MVETKKEEIIGAIEYAPIMDGGDIKIPDTMWHNIIRNQPHGWQDEGHLRIESLGNDTYKITKINEEKKQTITGPVGKTGGEKSMIERFYSYYESDNSGEIVIPKELRKLFEMNKNENGYLQFDVDHKKQTIQVSQMGEWLLRVGIPDELHNRYYNYLKDNYNVEYNEVMPYIWKILEEHIEKLELKSEPEEKKHTHIELPLILVHEIETVSDDCENYIIQAVKEKLQKKEEKTE